MSTSAAADRDRPRERHAEKHISFGRAERSRRPHQVPVDVLDPVAVFTRTGGSESRNAIADRSAGPESHPDDEGRIKRDEGGRVEKPHERSSAYSPNRYQPVALFVERARVDDGGAC